MTQETDYRSVELTEGEDAAAENARRLSLHRPVERDPIFIMGGRFVGWCWKKLRARTASELADLMEPECPFGKHGDVVRDQKGRLWEIVFVLVWPNTERPWSWQVELTKVTDATTRETA